MLSAVMLSVALSGQAATPGDRNCLDDTGRDRCAATERARVLEALDMAPAEQEASSGAEIYRAFYADGYGRDMPAIAFERRPGHAPNVVFYTPGRTMTALASLAAWESVKAEATIADRDLVELSYDGPPGQAPMPLCLHAWSTTIEIINAEKRWPDPAPFRRKTQSACGDGLASRYAFHLAAEAIKQFPACGLLKAEDHRNDIIRLAVCAGMEGDRLAAVELANQIGTGRITPRRDIELRPSAWADWMGSGWTTRLQWGGETMQNEQSRLRNPVGEFLAARETADPELRGYIGRFNGVSASRVEVTGQFATTQKTGDQSTRLRADFLQVWKWSAQQRKWVMDSWTVEPFTANP